MAYTTIDKPTDYFNTVLWTGNATDDTTISGVGFQSDWTWFKERSSTSAHTLQDSVRGATKQIFSNATDAEATNTTKLKSWNSDGFIIGTSNAVNQSSQTYVAWNWKAGTSFTNDASATSVGSVDSTGSINTTAGISIISWTSLASGSNYTIAHGLSAVPAMIIMKGRHESNSWQVYHHKNTSAPETDYLDLSTTDATADYPVWNDTAPTSSVFSCGTWSGFDDGGTMIAYCFAEKKGYSKFGSYTGNGSADGTFVYTGFSPAVVMIKLSSVSGENWYMFDNKRDTDNVKTQILYPNLNNAEATGTTNIDFLSNGFKLRNSGDFLNGSGRIQIYMAFAEHPFVSSTGTPVTAK